MAVPGHKSHIGLGLPRIGSHRMCARAALGAALLFATLTASGGAQAGPPMLSGTIRDSASGVPLRGAVVVVRDSAGGSIARDIANVRGHYRVALGAGARRVEVIHIGSRPRVVDLP